MTEKVSGIYRIVCVKNGRYYYGSSKNIFKRWDVHKCSLRKNSHCNSIIQRSWNKHGESTFRIELEKLVEEARLFEVEQVYLDEHVGKSNCMNINSVAQGGSSFTGRKHSLKSRKKMSEAKKGKTHSLETRKKMSEAKKGKTPLNWYTHTHDEKAQHKRSESLKESHCDGQREDAYKKIKIAVQQTYDNGRVGWNEGKHLSPEHRAKIGEAVSAARKKKEEL